MDDLQPGDPRSVGGYRLLGRLGAGGMGQVYLGVSPSGRRVAVKLIHPLHAGTAQFRERFAREIDAARRVGGFHTAVVVDADPRADPPWMITAYIDGPSLQAEVERGGPLPLVGVRALGAGLAEGLAAIHACGLVHRDLKPANVILAADGPRIIDFGIARAVDATTGLTSTGVVVGTFAYMSPEQLRGLGAERASDVFALGGVLAFAATGRPPFGREPAASVMFRIVADPPDLAGLADPGLRELIGRCLAKSPQDRPKVADLLTAFSGPATAAVPVAAPAAFGQAFPAAAPAAPIAAVSFAAGTPAQNGAPVPVSTGREAPVPPGPGRPAGTPLTWGPRADAGPTGGTPTGVGPTGVGPTGAGPAGAVADRAPGTARDGGGRRGRRSRRLPAALGAAGIIGAALAIALPILLSSGTPAATPGRHQTTAAGPANTGSRKATPSLRATPSRGATSSRRPSVSATASRHSSTTSAVITERDLTLQASSTGIAFSPNGTLLADDTGSQIDLFDVSTGSRAGTLTGPPTTTPTNGFTQGPLAAAAFNPSGTLLAAGSADGDHVYLWNTSTDDLVTTLTGPSPKNADFATYTGVAFSPDGSLLAASDENGAVYVWNVDTGALVYDIVTAEILSSVAFSPNGKFLAAGGETGTRQAFMWDVATGERVANFVDPARGGESSDVSFSPDSTLLAVADLNINGPIYLWNTTSHDLVATLTGVKPDGGVFSLAWNPDGTLLAATYNYSFTYLWDVAAGKTVGHIHDPSDLSMDNVAFSPDGKLLAVTARTDSGGGYIYLRLTSQLTS
ncbi:MAG TPA: protein kinase [Streptosporangiaceae bacterium]|nr:protein kinase [Streptosporangiaceae bacterium]